MLVWLRLHRRVEAGVLQQAAATLHCAAAAAEQPMGPALWVLLHVPFKSHTHTNHVLRAAAAPPHIIQLHTFRISSVLVRVPLHMCVYTINSQRRRRYIHTYVRTRSDEPNEVCVLETGERRVKARARRRRSPSGRRRRRCRLEMSARLL